MCENHVPNQADTQFIVIESQQRQDLLETVDPGMLDAIVQVPYVGSIVKLPTSAEISAIQKKK